MTCAPGMSLNTFTVDVMKNTLVFWMPSNQIPQCREPQISLGNSVHSSQESRTVTVMQGNNVRKVNCCCVFSAFILNIETSSLWAVIVNKNSSISVSLVSEEDKSI